ncbi:hypothetical protein Vretifemale_7609 [Volvox reticuliferus]|nr:hypothetical protein Vretifemale_7609 [Volvox reticuliferus]
MAAPVVEALPPPAALLVPTVTICVSPAGAGAEGSCSHELRVNMDGVDNHDNANAVMQQQRATEGAGLQPLRHAGEEMPLSSKGEGRQREDRPIAAAAAAAAACQGDVTPASKAADAINKSMMAVDAAAVSAAGSHDDGPASRCKAMIPLSSHVRGGGGGGGNNGGIVSGDYEPGSNNNIITAGCTSTSSAALLVDSSRDTTVHGNINPLLPISTTSTSNSNQRNMSHVPIGGKSASKKGAAAAAGTGPLHHQQTIDEVPNSLEATLKQEVEVLARCQHPNIVCLHAACLKAPWLCLVMELMDTSLDRLIHGEQRLLPLDTVIHIAIQTARGLAYLHPTIVHRDLKPGNVLISNASSSRPVVKLADFGLSRLRDSVLITKNPEVGTAPYIAPEAFDSKNFTITDRVDVYALGIMLWEMLAGRRPWAGQNMVVIAIIVAMHQRRPPVGLLSHERCPPKLRSLIHMCWDPDPARRPAAAEVVKALMLVQEALSIGERPMGSRPREEHKGPLPLQPSPLPLPPEQQQQQNQQQQLGGRKDPSVRQLVAIRPAAGIMKATKSETEVELEQHSPSTTAAAAAGDPAMTVLEQDKQQQLAVAPAPVAAGVAGVTSTTTAELDEALAPAEAELIPLNRASNNGPHHPLLGHPLGHPDGLEPSTWGTTNS